MRFVNSVVVAAVFAGCACAQVGFISKFAGTGPTAGYTGDGASATAATATLSSPGGVATDAAGNVYIADTANSVVRMVSAATGFISTFAGSGVSGSAGDGLPANNPLVKLTGPTGVAVDASGNVYIADGPAARIRVVSASTGVITTFAGSGTSGFSGDGAAATGASLNFPAAVAVDSAGNVYIADAGNHRVRKVAGGVISTLAGNAQFGYNGDNVAPTATSLNIPQGVAVDATGNVFIADTQNHRIRKVSGGLITTVAGIGTPGFSGDLGAGTNAAVNTPKGVAVDAFGNLYIADTGNHAIRKVSSGTITTVAGTGTSGFLGDGGRGASALLNLPTGVAVDATAGFTYVADTGNNEVRVITNSFTSAVIPHFAAGGSYVTGIFVVNKGTQPAAFTVTFYNDAGAPVTVPVTGGVSSGNTLTDTIPALGTGYYELGSLTGATTISGSATIQSVSALVFQAQFRHQGAAPTPYEAAFTASLGSGAFEIPFDATTYALTGAQIYTGFGVANVDGASSGTITCVARDNTGTVIPGAITIPALNPQGHWAGYNFPALVGKRGTLDCTSTTRVSVVALRAIGTDAISALPVILK